MIRRSGCKATADVDAFTCEEECADQVSHYEILGLEHQAPIAQVKKAFRRLSVKYHPDKNRNNETARMLFGELREAYDVLGDSAKKQLYDSGTETTVNSCRRLSRCRAICKCLSSSSTTDTHSALATRSASSAEAVQVGSRARDARNATSSVQTK